MTCDEKELITEKFAGIKAMIQSRDDIIMNSLEFIKEQTTKTNGRVSVLENNVSDLQHFRTKKIAEIVAAEQLKRDRKWFIGTLLTIIAILAGLLFSSCKTPAPIIITETERIELIPDTVFITLPADTVIVTDTIRIYMSAEGELIVKPIQAFTEHAGAEAGIKNNRLWLRIWNITEPFIYPTESRIIWRTKTEQLPPIEIPYIPWWIIAIIISLLLLLILTKLRIL